MAMRRPIVATTIDGIGEVLTDNVTALMVPPRNSAELAEKSLLLLKDEETAQRLGASAHEHSREYDVSTCARRLEELYRNLHSLKMSDHTGPYTDCSAKSPTEVVGKKRMMKP
jgi:glycosyltransferase involved in cell wall biosynthesis